MFRREIHQCITSVLELDHTPSTVEFLVISSGSLCQKLVISWAHFGTDHLVCFPEVPAFTAKLCAMISFVLRRNEEIVEMRF